MRRLIITLFLTLSLLLSCSTNASDATTPMSFTRFESLTNNRLPIIHIDVNGQRYDFLIASSANISLIDSTACADRKLLVKDNTTGQNVTTFGGVIEKTKHVSLMNENFYVHDIHRMVEEVKEYTGIKVDGVIGYDILEHNKSTIDFEKQLISNINTTTNAKLTK